MNDESKNCNSEAPLPVAIIAGDYNVGKSLLLNALLRDNLLFTGREESRIPPILIAPALVEETRYAAWNINAAEAAPKSHAQFLGLRGLDGTPCDYDALAALAPNMPFSRLVLVDTPGGSTEARESALWPDDARNAHAMIALVTDIEYWPARHTMRLIAEHQERYASHFIVVANMADHLNPEEIRRIRDKAARRMQTAGISPAPEFFAVSARLEMGRRNPEDEYRRRIQREVRDLCDAGFDALRVALYEFEAKCPGNLAMNTFEALFQSAVATALMHALLEETSC